MPGHDQDMSQVAEQHSIHHFVHSEICHHYEEKRRTKVL
jgi:hypothetical protein